MSNGIGRTQNVGKNPSVVGEMGRNRAKFQAPPGVRTVKIFKGPRDNYEETSQIYLDEDGHIAGEVIHETANSVIVGYPEETFKANQKAYEDLAIRRVKPTEKVSGSSSDIAHEGKTDTLENLMGDARPFDQ